MIIKEIFSKPVVEGNKMGDFLLDDSACANCGHPEKDHAEQTRPWGRCPCEYPNCNCSWYKAGTTEKK